jgi:hypothetical protein
VWVPRSMAPAATDSRDSCLGANGDLAGGRFPCEPVTRAVELAPARRVGSAASVADGPIIVYDLALRSLDQQERELGELQARASMVSRASPDRLISGAVAIGEHGGLSFWSVVVVGVLVLTGPSLYALRPRELSFAFDARATYASSYPLPESVPRRSFVSPTGDPAPRRLALAYLGAGTASRADGRVAQAAWRRAVGVADAVLKRWGLSVPRRGDARQV